MKVMSFKIIIDCRCTIDLTRYQAWPIHALISSRTHLRPQCDRPSFLEQLWDVWHYQLKTMEGCSSLAYLDSSIHLQIVHDTITNNVSALLPHYCHWGQKEIISNTHKQGLISFLYSTRPSRLPCPTILIMNTLYHNLYDPSSSICRVFFLALFHVVLRRATCHMWRSLLCG